MIESKSDAELMEIFLAIATNSSYPKLINSLEHQSDVHVAWAATIAEEQGYTPFISYGGLSPHYNIAFSKDTQLTAYIPLIQIEQ